MSLVLLAGGLLGVGLLALVLVLLLTNRKR